MSGGHFNYTQYQIGQIADEIKLLIERNQDESLDEFGDPVGLFYSKETIDRFKEAVHALQVAQIYAQRIDWLVCGDDAEESFLARLQTELGILQGETNE